MPEHLSTLLQARARETATRLEQHIRVDLASALANADPLLPEVLAYALMGGGKRIRPLLVILSARACGSEATEIWQLACALEYLHVATLIHDDVLDHAALRRGRDSVVARYGMATAILCGDWLHARSMYLVGRLTGDKGLELFCSATQAMVDGEFLQLRHCADVHTSEERYMRIIHCKTAGLISCTCGLGALYAKADPSKSRALKEYGHLLGTAFQVVDDLLDYLGDTLTGKTIGNDFREGKITLPVIRALQAANPEEQQQLEALLTSRGEDPGQLEAVRGYIAQLGGFDAARNEARALVDAAISELALLPDSEEKHLLEGLGVYVLNRKK